jgi:hypothetical protein
VNPPDASLVLDLVPSPVPDVAPVPVVASRGRAAQKGEKVDGLRAAVAIFDRLFRDAYGERPTWSAKAGGQAKNLLRAHSLGEVERRMEILFRAPPRWLTPPFDFSTFVQHFDKLVAPTSEKRTPGQQGMDRQLDRVARLERQAAEPHAFDAPADDGPCRLCGWFEAHRLHTGTAHNPSDGGDDSVPPWEPS